MKFLKLNIEGGEFIFRAEGYSAEENMRNEWCLVNLAARIDTIDDHTDMTGSRVSSKIDLRIENDESLMCSELHALEEYINDVLSGKLTEEKRISAMEPYMEFVISPIDPRDSVPIPCLQWLIYVWHEDSPTDHHVSLCFFGEELKLIGLYLKYLRGAVEETDDRLKDCLLEKF